VTAASRQASPTSAVADHRYSLRVITGAHEISSRVGQPMDGCPQAAYAIWQDNIVTLRRATYDVEETVPTFDAFDL